MPRLDGKIAFVTGAGGGIGRAVCRRFVEEGARVVAVDIVPAAAREAVSDLPQSEAIAVGCDVTDSSGVREAVERAADAFGGLSVLCNLAGGSSPQDAPVLDADEKEFWRAIGLDLFGTFLVTKHVLPELMRSDGASIINTASIVSSQAVPGRDCYTSAKGGIVSLTRSWAATYAREGVRVNAIAPGITLTPRVMARPDSVDPDSYLVKKHLLGLVEPIDVAQLAVYLASDESRRVTGQVLQVDSGATLE